MDCKPRRAGQWACGVAVSALALAPLAAQAQDATTGSSTTTTSSGGSMGSSGTTGTMKGADSAGMSSMAMSSTPMQVTGTVLRYYTDRSGYVTAMDVQTANGVEMVRFAPGMGQRLMSTYPVGGQTSVWAMGSPYMGMTRWDVVGMGNNMPAAGSMMMPYMASDVALLDSEPYVMGGARMVTVNGKLRNFITNDVGEVIAIVLGDSSMGRKSMMGGSMGGGSMSGGTSTSGPAGGGAMSGSTMSGTGSSASMTGDMMGMGMMNGETLVRVPREMRHVAPGYAGTNRVSGLFKGADVSATGYPEAPRYGVLSMYPNRIVGSAIVVDGRAVGALGFPMMSMETSKALLGLDVMGMKNNEEMKAAGMGYRVYDPGSMSGASTMSPTSGTSGGATSTGSSTSTSTTTTTP